MKLHEAQKSLDDELAKHKFGVLPSIHDMALWPLQNARNLQASIGVAAMTAGPAWLMTGQVMPTVAAGVIGQLLAGLASAWEQRPNNDGWLLQKPDDAPEQESQLMDMELTGIYRKVLGDTDIVVVKRRAAQFDIHVIYHESAQIKLRIEALGRALGIRSRVGSDDIDAIYIPVWGRGCSALLVSRSKTEWDDIEFDRDLLTPGTLVSHLGGDIEGKPILYDRSDAPNLIAAGTTGSGKTFLLRADMSSIKHSFPTAKVYAIDYKGGLKHAPHDVFTNSMEEGISLVDRVLNEAKENWRIIDEAGLDNWFEYEGKFPGKLAPIFLYIDEFPVFQGRADELIMKRWEEQKAAVKAHNAVNKDAPEPMPLKPDLIIDKVGEMARVFRAGGMFVSIGIQKPEAAQLPTKFRDMFDARAAHRVPDGASSRVIINRNGAESLPGKGAFIFQCGGEPAQIGRAAIVR